MSHATLGTDPSGYLAGVVGAEQSTAIPKVPANDMTEATLLKNLQEPLVRYKIPRTIEFVSEPLRDDAGKVRRKALREARIKR